MRVVLLSRPFNRAGFAVLETLAAAPDCEVVALVLPPFGPEQAAWRRLDRAWSAPFERLAHRVRGRWQGTPPLRFERSLRRRARALGVPVEQMGSFAHAAHVERLRHHAPDVLVVGGGWPRLLPPSVIHLAPGGALNVHPSLLPAFRGTDVHRWQIAAGVRRSGVTVHRVDEEFDSGRRLAQRAFDLPPDATPQWLAARAAELSGPLLLDVLRRDAGDDAHAASEPSPETVAPPGSEGEAAAADRLHGRWPWGDSGFLALDASKPASTLECFVRAATQESFEYDGPWLDLGGESFIVRRAAIDARSTGEAVGHLAVREGWPVLQCGEGALRLERVQPRRPLPNRTRSLDGRAFARRVMRGRTIPVASAPARRDGDA